MLEQVRESGSPRLLVARPDLVPGIDDDDWRGVILVQDHFESVREGDLFVLELRHTLRCRPIGGPHGGS